MKIHPHEDLLLEMLLSPGAVPSWLVEHVQRCEPCRAKLRALEGGTARVPKRMARVLPWPPPAADYTAVLKSAARQGELNRLAFARERAAAGFLLTELLCHPAQRREFILRNHPRFSTWGLYERLVEGARDLGPTEPVEAEMLAQLALVLADVLERRRRYRAGLIEDLRARAWGYLANSRRVRSDLQGAEDGFERAFKHLRGGTREPLEKALLLDLMASLRIDQRRFDEALRLLRCSIAIFRELGDDHRGGRGLVKMAVAHYHAGEPESGVPLLRQALELIDPAEEPRLLLSTWHNLVLFHAETGRFMEAQGLFIKARPIYRRFPDSWAQNRRHWVQGKIARGLGQVGEAERHLLVARDGFVSEGIAYDTALASLDLASLYAEQGRLAELKDLAGQMMPFFASRQIHRETMAALTFFYRAAAAETASTELVRQVAGYLERARFQPTLRFEPPPAKAGS
jgi:tetratricopeptide (TPR) repeat protein